jgi:hypothetical protein
VALGERGVAVGERGAALAWRVGRDGTATIDQTDGDVFYRVERGGAFVVRTPAGDVIVTGTCFRVEVHRMSSKHRLIIAAGAGALVAATAVVTVYEGGVRVGNAQGTIRVASGERAVLAAGEAPRVVGGEPHAESPAAERGPSPPAAQATPAALAARYEVQERELHALRTKVRAFEEKEAADKARREAANSVDPSPGTLEEWAKQCQVPIPAPPFLNEDLQPGAAETSLREAGLSQEEVELAAEIGERMRQQALERMRALYVEATGRKDLAQGLSFVGMLLELYAKAPAGEGTEVRRRLSAERAGLSAPGAASPPSVLERAFRASLGLHEEFEQALAKELGPQKAREINRNTSGKSNLSLGGGCR